MIGVLTLLVFSWYFGSRATSDKLLVDAETAFAAGDLRTAQRIALNVLKRNPDSIRASWVAAQCFEAQNHPEQALQLLSSIPTGQGRHSVQAACLAGDILFYKLCRPLNAESKYRQALGDDPLSTDANDRLSILMTITSQWWRQIPFRLAAVRAGQFDTMNLLVMALGEKALVNPEFTEVMQQVTPHDPLVMLAAARLAIETENHDAAIEQLVSVLELAPDLDQAHVLLGKEYFQLGDDAKFVEWLSLLPPSVDDHPGIWVLRGKWSLKREHQEVALRCFCEALARDPNHPDALYQAGRILVALNRTEVAQPFLDRAEKLQEFINATKAADAEAAFEETKRAAEIAESLGNYWEAFGWASLLASKPAFANWSSTMATRLEPMLPDLPLKRTHPDHNPVSAFDYHNFPLPVANVEHLAATPSDGNRNAIAEFGFRDQAASAGISFQYFNGSRHVANGTKYMYEVMGGGVAVFDIDHDHRPDLYFAQGSSWPPDKSNREFLDRVYLNTGQSGFLDVTDVCGVTEAGFSQGVSAGDYNSDGFADILVANIGQNSMYMNNGDGTFAEVSAVFGFDHSDWTTSCAIADISGDAHPDLYLVNYLQGEDLFTRTCSPNDDGVCLPQHFEGAPDRFLMNGGNGTFEDVTDSYGFKIAGGKGLGIVVGKLNEAPGLNVFVANDTVPNFYFEDQGLTNPGVPRFRETALISGLALNDSGDVQACMGVAAGDADGDGALDLFVTNFFGETNTLYRHNHANSLFEDVTLQQRLHQPSLSKLGFGTQFLDADLDGWLDLVIANGHIGNYSSDGRTPYQMRPQFFVNQGKDGFYEVESLGTYFEDKMVGRSLARLDWNGDAKPDFVVTHLDAPAALLENITKPTGNYIVLKLCGVHSNRDAIGTIVRIETDNRQLIRQLTAGDGFQASNHRILTFGLGTDDLIRKLTVTWPSGQVNEYSSVPANTRLILIEGREPLRAAVE